MRNKHLSETEIQHYLDNTLRIPELERAKAHLRHCPACRSEVESYREVFQVLAGENKSLLSPGFSRKIAAEIEASSRRNSAGRDWEYWLALLGLLAGSATTLYFTGTGFITALFTEWERPALSVDFSVFSKMFQQLSAVDFPLFGAAALILLLVTLGDHFILRRD